MPFGQRIVWANSLVIRTTGDPVAIVPLVRERIWSVNRNVPISEVRSMDDLYHVSLGRPRMVLVLLGSSRFWDWCWGRSGSTASWRMACGSALASSAFARRWAPMPHRLRGWWWARGSATRSLA